MSVITEGKESEFRVLGGFTKPKPILQNIYVEQFRMERLTISDNNIGQWLPFPPYPLPNVVLQVQKNIERKVDIIVATLKEGKRGRAFV